MYDGNQLECNVMWGLFQLLYYVQKQIEALSSLKELLEDG
jgi:hypothetical protein